MLKQCPSKGDKYVIDEELQHTDHVVTGHPNNGLQDLGINGL
jgi:hypothetical protein